MSRHTAYAILAYVLVTCSAAHAQTPTTKPDDRPVTRQEFNKLLEEFRTFRAEHATVVSENERLKSDLADVQADLTALKEKGWQADLDQALAKERQAVLSEVREEIRDRTEPNLLGLHNFTLGGFAAAGYHDYRSDDSTFNAYVAPIVLWKPTDRLLFESRFDIFLAEDNTATELAYAQISYLLNDYVTLGAGKFVLPFGIFWERARAPWINKLPTMPLVYSRGFVGESGLGVQIRGGAAFGNAKINYAAYFINGPEFRTNPSEAGRLGFGNFRDSNNNKSFGGRVGFLPVPELEIGASLLAGRVGVTGTPTDGVDTTILGLDFTFGREIEAIKGRFDLRGEFVFVDTDDVNFGGGFLNPLRFDNKRNGWYVQAAYRPTLVDHKLFEEVDVKNLEFVVRYDQLREPGPFGLGTDRDQLTLGLDYWIRPSIVLKTAYVFDDAHGGGARDHDGFYAQVGIGF